MALTPFYGLLVCFTQLRCELAAAAVLYWINEWQGTAMCIFSHSPFPLGAGNDIAETLSPPLPPPFVFNLTIELRGNDMKCTRAQFLTKTRVQFVVDLIQ